jgi:hypothetical protein
MKQIEAIMPGSIAIICRYAVFLKRIVNNENDAIMQYEKAAGVFRRMLSQKGLIDYGRNASQMD